MTTAEQTYGIKQVAGLTGLSAERLRAWERRYAVVRPARRANGYRTYTTRQVALLRVFAQLIADGARIGDLIDEPMARITTRAARRHSDHPVVGPFLDAIRSLDRRALEGLVAQESARRGPVGFAGRLASSSGVRLLRYSGSFHARTMSIFMFWLSSLLGWGVWLPPRRVDGRARRS